MRYSCMKVVVYSADARNDLARHGNVAAKIKRYADTGAGDVKSLAGATHLLRLRVGDFRVLFEEGEKTILVIRVRPRGEAYG
jgi:mRNA interferase RelE/StbE